MSDLTPLPPLETAPLFPALHAELIALLRSLEPADWERPTVAGRWRVRDVATHLLDGDLRTLSAHRDGHALGADGPVHGYADVVALIGRLNAEGVAYGARLSPRVLTDLLELTGHWMSDFVASLDMDAPALFAVAWAGETESDNRFDTAREYTERWHHQMQIRDAVGARGRGEVLLGPAFLLPLIETSLRVLPHAYRDVDAAEGTSLVIRLALGSEGAIGAWSLRRASRGWRLQRGEAVDAAARVTVAADLLWRVFYNAVDAERALRDLGIEGRAELVMPLLRARSVMV